MGSFDQRDQQVRDQINIHHSGRWLGGLFASVVAIVAVVALTVWRSGSGSPAAAPPAGASAATRSLPPPACSTLHDSDAPGVKQRVCWQRDGDKVYMLAYVSSSAAPRVDVYLWLSSKPGNVYLYPTEKPWSRPGITVGSKPTEYRALIDMALTPGSSYDVHVSTKSAGGKAPDATSPTVTGYSMPFTY
ncbi:hypothetical protein ABT095_36595 [Kitasatospora sp. NPDC002227]|uniref:hypothetical protein n=1 Tax=Kitasatospora sp. NPDC002227 TaxID=3154773 RepID=UPI0033292C17